MKAKKLFWKWPDQALVIAGFERGKYPKKVVL